MDRLDVLLGGNLILMEIAATVRCSNKLLFDNDELTKRIAIFIYHTRYMS